MFPPFALKTSDIWVIREQELTSARESGRFLSFSSNRIHASSDKRQGYKWGKSLFSVIVYPTNDAEEKRPRKDKIVTSNCGRILILVAMGSYPFHFFEGCR